MNNVLDHYNWLKNHAQRSFNQISKRTFAILDQIINYTPEFLKQNKWLKSSHDLTLPQQERKAIKANLQGTVASGFVGAFTGICIGGSIAVLSGGAGTPLIAFGAVLGAISSVLLTAKPIGAYLEQNEPLVPRASYQHKPDINNNKPNQGDTSPQNIEMNTFNTFNNGTSTSKYGLFNNETNQKVQDQNNDHYQNITPTEPNIKNN